MAKRIPRRPKSSRVGYHDTATNTSVRTVAQNLTGGVVEFYEREREPNIGGLLSIKKYDQSLNNLLATPWQASTTAAGAPSVGRAPGHQLDEVIIDGVSFNQSHDQRGRLQDALDMVLHYDGLNRLSHVSDTLDENVLESFLKASGTDHASRLTDEPSTITASRLLGDALASPASSLLVLPAARRARPLTRFPHQMPTTATVA